ncbi:Hyaluronan mediated motility receptor [Acropora cervicornis]|uniref:Hyaluronan mediated motility receptor n=1 Tax=Acropora cervicornis TaxID=6130 RepID=A0AAD9QLC0_ACRCE|nr:Hyaluronan mediated motility receptor [Acropora cervicornis]
MFLKSKRFHDKVPQAPPVGLYDVLHEKQGPGAGFGKGKRFADLKDAGPGFGSNSSLLDISCCSTSSKNDSKCSQFATPLPLRKCRKVSSSTPNPKGDPAPESETFKLLSERQELENRLCAMQMEIEDLEKRVQSLLQEKTGLESDVTCLKKEVQDLKEERDVLLAKVQENSNTTSDVVRLEEEIKMAKLHLQDKEGLISSLKLQLSCAAGNAKADLELEMEKNKAFSARITSLENAVADVSIDRDDVEEANRKLHGREYGEKLEISLKSSAENFQEAQSRISQLQETNENLKNNNHDLEVKVMEMIEREQRSEEKERSLSAENLSLQSRLEKCENDYQQRLSEEMMTQNLRSLTEKYRNLEDSFADFRSEAEKEKDLISAELEVTKDSLQKSQQESEQQKNTCVFLKRQSEEIQKESEQLNGQVENLKTEAESLRCELLKRQEEVASAKQEQEVEAVKDELARAKFKVTETEENLKHEVNRHQEEVSELEEQLRTTEANFSGQLKAFEEKAAKSKEEFGRRLVETQKKLSQTEINFEKWKTKYEDLWIKIEPFKDQLDEYEAERRALLCQNSRAKEEVAKLGQQYAKLLGHQNKKQKIHHVIKLKEENLALKDEKMKLRETLDKQKRAMKKLEDKVDQLTGKKRFNPAEAFTHTKENTPLAVISNGNASVRL